MVAVDADAGGDEGRAAPLRLEHLADHGLDAPLAVAVGRLEEGAALLQGHLDDAPRVLRRGRSHRPTGSRCRGPPRAISRLLRPRVRLRIARVGAHSPARHRPARSLRVEGKGAKVCPSDGFPHCPPRVLLRRRAASAAVFTRFLRDTSPEAAAGAFAYLGLLYEPSAPPPGDKLRKGAVNAVLDYRYTTSPELPGPRSPRERLPGGRGRSPFPRGNVPGGKFHDGAYGSCTKLVVDIGRERFGWSAPDLDELVEWADVIDAARFADADAASSFESPAMQVAAVIQEQGDDHLTAALIPLLGSRPLAEAAASPLVSGGASGPSSCATTRWRSAWPTRGSSAATWRTSTSPTIHRDGCEVRRVGASPLTAQYAVTLQRNPKRVKISAGFNPWAKRPRRHHVASLCERYGGGGHPVAGSSRSPRRSSPAPARWSRRSSRRSTHSATSRWRGPGAAP